MSCRLGNCCRCCLLLEQIDRLYQWKANPKSDVVKTIKQQSHFTNDEFKKRVNEIIVQVTKQTSFSLHLSHKVTVS